MNKIKIPVLNMFKVNMDVKAGEKVLVITDYPERQHWISNDFLFLNEASERTLLAKIVYEIAAENLKENQVEFYAYPLTGMHGKEPPRDAAEKMKSYDVAIAITTFSLSHTNAREEATEAGVRIASMPGFTVDMFEPDGPMSADYLWIKDTSLKIAKWLDGKKHVRIENGYGTKLSLSVEGRKWDVDIGLYVNKGEWGNLPAGEVYIAPLEGSTEGTLIAPKGWYPNLKEDMVFHIKEGLVYKIDGGGDVGDNFRKLLGLNPINNSPEYVARRNIAELGIGTNPKAKRPDNVLEAEKIFGTVHVAIGDNSHFGGKVKADLQKLFWTEKYLWRKENLRFSNFLLTTLESDYGHTTHY